jgi:pectin methylesterase-like acyl-CoA thioesterase
VPRTRPASRLTGVLAAAGLAAVTAGSVVGVTPAQAATSFTVTYTVAPEWPGVFVANVAFKNTGDAVSGWTVNWAFPASGQAVTSAWGTTVSQSGLAVTATNAGYNGAVAPGGTVSFGFQGTFTGSNPVPTGFTVNGSSTGGGTTTTTSVPTTSTTPATTTTTTPSRTTTTTTTTPTTSRTTTTSTSSSAKPTVAADGTGSYRTVQAAIDAVPANNTTRRVITIKAGTYREIVTVPSNKPYITLQGLGSSPGQVNIVNNHGANNYGTFNSATVFVNGHDFTATNLQFSNDFDETNAGSGTQAVAVNDNADRTTFDNVRFIADQDTLLVNASARSYLVNSYIEGTVDFIFGDGIAVFDNCSIYEKRSTGGPLTAARTPSSRTYGFLIYKSTVTGAVAGKTQLGRPWGQAAQVLFRESNLSNTIATSQPWIDMSGNTWQNARFSEYRNTGAGATVNSNRRQLSDSEAANYTPQKYLAGSDGWNPIR